MTDQGITNTVAAIRMTAIVLDHVGDIDLVPDVGFCAGFSDAGAGV